MHERRFQGALERLRAPQRVAMLEVERVVDACLNDLLASTVVDVGTGSGIFAEAFANRSLQVTGVDPNPEMLDAAKHFVPQGTFVEGTIEVLPFEDRSFDLVFLGHVLHESDDLLQALKETHRVVRHRVGILEWPYRKEESGPPIEHRLSSEKIIAAAEQAGFAKIESLQLQHMILFLLSVY